MNNSIKDITLASSGKEKIQWVKRNMPLLRSLENELLKQSRLKGLKLRYPFI